MMILMRRTAYIAALLTLFTLAILALPVSVFAEQGFAAYDWSDVQGAIDRSEEEAVIYLRDSITPDLGDSYIKVPSGKKITIDLCGNSIDRKLTEAQRAGYVIFVQGDLTIRDTDGDNTGTITGGYNESSGSANLDTAGGISVVGGKLTLESGNIAGNTAGGSGIGGGGVNVSDSGEFYMEGGVISGNEAEGYNNGGGVNVAGKATFVMSGGTIESNKATGGYGGGVYVGNGQFKMNGGTIRENSAYLAGGVHVHRGDYSTYETPDHESFGFYMSGGRITENSAENEGGVFISTNENVPHSCPIYLSGSPVIIDNKEVRETTTERSNLALGNAVPFTLTEKLDESARIGVSRITWDYDQRENPEVFAKGVKEYATVANFVSDSDPYIIGITADGAGALCFPVTATFDKGDDRITGETPAMTVPRKGEFQLPENGFDENNYLFFTGWIVDDYGEVKQPGDTVIAPDDMTIKAKWAEKESIAYAEVALSQDTFVYDGTEQEPEIKVILDGEPLTEDTDYTVKWPDPEPVDADTYIFTIFGKGHYNGETVPIEYKIEPAPLTLTSADLVKEYDGDPLTNADAADVGVDVNEKGLLVEDGWADGEGAVYTFTGSVTLPGEQKANAFTITPDRGTKLTNYDLSKTEGTLAITDRTEPFAVKVTGKRGGGLYNGQTHSVSGFVGEVEGKGVPVQANGKTFYVSGLTSEASGTNVADSLESIPVTGTAVVKDADDNDVTDQFSVTIVNGSFTISRTELLLVSADITKEFDGTALTNADAASLGAQVNENGLRVEVGWIGNEGASYTFLGNVRLPGEERANAFTVNANIGTSLNNYHITKIEGKLKVTDRTEPFKVAVTANSLDTEYNGETQSVNGFDGEVEGKGVPVTANEKQFYVRDVISTASGKNVTDSVEEIEPDTTSMKVTDQDGNDVTRQFEVSITKGHLKISPTALTLASADLTKEYDGKALTNADAASLGVLVNEHGLLTEEGWKNGDGAAYEFTGSAALPGEHAGNTFTITANEGTLLDNYTIAKTEGSLTITDRTKKIELTLKGNSYTGTYDGEEHTASGFVGDVEGKGTAVKVGDSTFYVTGFSSQASGTNVSDSVAAIPIKVTGAFKVEDENGNDVTSQFTASLISGKLTIKKATYKLTVKGRKPSVKYTKLKKKNQTIKRAKAITVKGKKGTLTYKKTSGNTKASGGKKILVNKKTGNITVKKGLKKGTYKIRVKVTDSGDANYSKQTATATVTIKVN